MLFRRFALVTTCIALMGVIANNLIQSTRQDDVGFSVNERLQEWERHNLNSACKHNVKFCVLSTATNKLFAQSV